jgi:hypothetical protein
MQRVSLATQSIDEPFICFSSNSTTESSTKAMWDLVVPSAILGRSW